MIAMEEDKSAGASRTMELLGYGSRYKAKRQRTVDVLSDEAAKDPDFIKAVHDIQDMQQRQGFLLGKGALDKNDLLYVREQEEQRKSQELERADSERTAFALMRSRASSLSSSGIPRSASIGSSVATDSSSKSVGGSSGRPKEAGPGGVAASIGRLKPIVKLKPKQPAKVAADTGKPQALGAVGSDAAAAAAAAAGGSSSPGAGEATAATANGGAAGRQAQQQGGTGEDDVGLPGLLGDYGSSSDSDDTGE